MCGIFGQFHLDGADPALVTRMAHCLSHRGPDGYGIHHDGRLAFGAGRLAIIDLSAPAGALFNEDRTLSVVFNGEIYNYRALRAELERAGHHFTTRTDTEVIVHGYEQWGLEVLERLSGMFAIGLWDSSRQRLLLARDRLGEKPLYVQQRTPHEWLFASEIKALWEHPQNRAKLNAQALPYLLMLGYMPPSHTLFEGVQKLAPGEYWLISSEGVTRARYWQPVMNTRTLDIGYDEAVKRVREALHEAVTSRMISDVPVGALLSGGVDSTAVVTLMQRAISQPIHTFTVGFDFASGSHGDQKFNVDAHYARQVARNLGTHHHEIVIPENDLGDILPHLIYHMDEPIAQVAIVQTAYVAALARHHGIPVLLSGDAGDELFLGYPHYRANETLERYWQLPPFLRDALLTPMMAQIPRWRGFARKARQRD